ncbi:hypothetical protein [Flavobacterium rhizosphaerae]|uniref:Uncharacterized protein n=1 Tax=Flavobacterium rhizosphaerae TaxID=3163298 RepID=A0ABW8YXV6_9FLAO
MEYIDQIFDDTQTRVNKGMHKNDINNYADIYIEAFDFRMSLHNGNVLDYIKDDLIYFFAKKLHIDYYFKQTYSPEINLFNLDDLEKMKEIYKLSNLQKEKKHWWLLNEFEDLGIKIRFLKSKLFSFGLEVELYYDEDDCLKGKLYKVDEKSTLLEEIVKPLAYKIALLNEIGFYELPKFRTLQVKDQNQIIKLLIGGSIDTIRNNRNSLNENSTVSSKYTAYKYKEDVKKLFN